MKEKIPLSNPHVGVISTDDGHADLQSEVFEKNELQENPKYGWKLILVRTQA